MSASHRLAQTLFITLLSLFCLLGTSACQPNFQLIYTEPLTTPNSTLNVSVAKEVEIVLPSLGAHPSYYWNLRSDYDTNLLAFQEEHAAHSIYAGRSAPPEYAPNRIFVFQTLAAGSTQLNFEQVPLAKDGSPSGNSRSFQIVIGQSEPNP